MVIFSIRSGFFYDANYLFRPTIISGRSLLSLIGRLLDDSGLDQNICIFLSSSLRVSKIYAYFSLRYDVKYDETCVIILMVTRIIFHF